MPDGRVRRGQPRDVHGERSVPRRGHLQSQYGSVLEPHRLQRDDVQRRQRMHADGHVSVGYMCRLQPGDVHRQRSMPCGRHVQSEFGRLLESNRLGRDHLHGDQPLRPRLRLRERDMHGVKPGHVHGERSVPRRRHVQSDDGAVLESDGDQRDDLQRRERVHADGLLSERDLHRVEPRHMHGQRPMPHGRHVQSEHGGVLEPDCLGRNRLHRNQPLQPGLRLRGR